MSTLAQLTVEYNARAVAAGKNPIKRFGGSIAQLQQRIDALPPVKAKAVKAAKTAKPARGESANQPGSKPTVAGRCQELVLAGKTNAEIWALVQAEFDLDDSKKSYPGWYRNHMKRKGLI